MSIEQKHIVRNAQLIFWGMFFLMMLIFGKVVWLQIVKGPKYRAHIERNNLRIDTIKANRGSIYARDGSLLATSMYRYEIRMDTKTVPADLLYKNLPALCKGLSRILGKPASYYKEKIIRAKKNNNRYLLIARNVNHLDYLALKKLPLFNQKSYLGGFIAKQKTYRAHPIGEMAKRLIGYDDYRGAPGLEGAYKKFLRGRNGYRLEQKIAQGQWKPVNSGNEVEPRDGMDIITTLDINIQDIAHQSLTEALIEHRADHGTAIVMDVKSGEIRAMVNLGLGKDGQYHENYNYAIGEAYEPGSTFKVASLMVALEDQVTDTAKIFDTQGGKWKVYNKWVKDSHEGGYGKISLARALEVSSNVAFAKMIYGAYKDQPEKFIRSLKSLHLMEKTGVSLKGEAQPEITAPGDKKWSGTTLPWLAFGYGVKLTPLQILTFYNAIANNGKMVKPKFVKEIKIQSSSEQKKVFETQVIDDRICSDKTLSKLKKIMADIVKRGTAKNIYLPEYSLAGKTGTSEAEYWTDHPYYIASFAGFFPIENPEYSCIVVIHKPGDHQIYGNIVAAPVFQKIAKKIYSATDKEIHTTMRNGIPPKLQNEYEKPLKILQKTGQTMPDLKGMPGMDAVKILESMGLRVQFHGTGTVKEQYPAFGTPVKSDNTVKLTLS